MEQDTVHPEKDQNEPSDMLTGELLFDGGYWGPFGRVTEAKPTNVLAERDDSVVKALCYDA